ncbi:MAG: hypothetical protein J6W95_03805 [Bacteroidales bacterium]|nr:hypothetical protein [Bacteroidales bacterium]
MKYKTLFHVLLVITMVWGSISTLSYIMMAVMMPVMQDMYNQSQAAFPAEWAVAMQRVFEVPRGFYAGAGVLYLLEVLGAVMMWRLRWTGFHCYTLARLLILVLPVLFIGRSYLGIGDIMMALLWVAMYYMIMRRMTAEEEEETGDKETEDKETGDKETEDK